MAETNEYNIINFGISLHEDLVSGKKIGFPLQKLFSSERRKQYLILYTGTESATHYVDDKAVQIPPNTALFIGPERLSHFERIPQSELQVLVFSELFYSRSAKDAHFLQHSPLFHHFDAVYMTSPPTDSLNYIKGLVRLLYLCQENIRNPLHVDLAHNVVQHILIVGTLMNKKSMEVSFEESVDNRLVLEFKDLIEKHFHSEKTVQFYTDKLHVTDKRLTQATKAVLNCSPKDIIMKKIMDEAKWQLLYTPKSIKEIAAELGYFDEQNFSAFFLKNEGIRPKNFVNLHKRGDL